MHYSLVQSNKALHIKYELIMVDAKITIFKAMLYSVFCFTWINESSESKEGWTFWNLQRYMKNFDWLTPKSFFKIW